MAESFALTLEQYRKLEEDGCITRPITDGPIRAKARPVDPSLTAERGFSLTDFATDMAARGAA